MYYLVYYHCPDVIRMLVRIMQERLSGYYRNAVRVLQESPVFIPTAFQYKYFHISLFTLYCSLLTHCFNISTVLREKNNLLYETNNFHCTGGLHMYDYQINKTGGNFMNRTLIALLLSASILFAGCGSTKEPAHNTSSETVTSTTVV